MKFDDKEPIEYNDAYFGKGKGCIVGVFELNQTEYYVIFPKNPFDKSFCPYMTFVLCKNKIISTPF